MVFLSEPFCVYGSKIKSWKIAMADHTPIANARQIIDPRVADLVRCGKIRVGLFLPQYTSDRSTGQLTSVWVESARIFASRLGVQLAIVEHSTPPEAIACLKTSTCDLLFLPLDARAADIGDFRTQFSNLTTPCYCQLARQLIALSMRTSPGFVSGPCEIMPQPMN